MPKRVLLVDDDAGIRAMIEMALSDAGYAVSAAADGAAALELAAQNPPDVILLDMRMPVMDGWAFAQEYRAQGGPQAPIIVCTAARDAAASAAQVQAAAYLAKPFDVADLLGCVERYTT